MAERPRVLLADNDEHCIQALEPALQQITQLTIVPSTDAALKAFAEAGPFDVVVVDVDLGSGGGIWLLEQVAASHPGCHRVLLSAQRPDDFPALRQRGVAHDVVRKPALIDHLVAVIMGPSTTSLPTQG